MRVLLVDDETRLVETLQRGLVGEGYLVDTALDGDAGLGLALTGDYAAIILDVLLPKRSGHQVCQALRRADVWTPVMMLTAKDGEYDQADGLDCGADDYLTKPFSFIVLTARLRALTRRGGPARSTVLSIGDLLLDPATRSCQRAGAGISLRTKEFAVLEILMREAPRVVGKQEILSHVWDMNADHPDNLVEVYVSALRRKVDAPFRRSSIRTVRGVGYQIVRDDPLSTAAR